MPRRQPKADGILVGGCPTKRRIQGQNFFKIFKKNVDTLSRFRIQSALLLQAFACATAWRRNTKGKKLNREKSKFVYEKEIHVAISLF
jgi:hypothetical protein